jgi:hypothetical protein
MSEMVWVVTGGSKRSTPYHTDEDCQVLERSGNYRPVPLNSLNGAWDECLFCADEVAEADPDFSDEVRNPGQPKGKPDGNVFLGEVWTASRGFVEVDVESQSKPTDRSFAEVAADD